MREHTVYSEDMEQAQSRQIYRDEIRATSYLACSNYVASLPIIIAVFSSGHECSRLLFRHKLNGKNIGESEKTIVPKKESASLAGQSY